MNEEELRRLLEKYYNGESTEEEESFLSEYFNGNNIPAAFEAEKDIFVCYKSAGKVPEPSLDFEAKIFAGIDASESKRMSQKFRKFILPYISAAAGILILAGSYFFFIHRAEPGDTYTDPEIAYAETMKILVDVSTQLNHGTKALEPVRKVNDLTTKSFKTINKSAKLIVKNMKSLSYLQNAIEISDLSVNKMINK